MSGETPEKKEKKVSDKDLDLSNAKRNVWLVKVPKYISDRWESMREVATKTQNVGKLKIIRRTGQKPLVSFRLDDTVVEFKPQVEEKDSVQIPTDHKFVVSNVASQTLAVFSTTAKDDPDQQQSNPDELPTMPGHLLALEGKVVQRADCRPVSDDSAYMKHKRQSIIQAIEPKRKTIQLFRPVNNYKPVSNHAANLAFEEKKKREGKKSRDDKERVMEILFSLFEKHQYYNIKDLVKHTRQPVTYLKEILKEVCSYNLKNPHKNMWELKAEFRHYKQDVPEKMEEDAQESSDDD